MAGFSQEQQEEGFCNSTNIEHCNHWWDCEPCCECGFDGGGKDCDCPRHNPDLYDENGMIKDDNLG